MLFKSDSDYSSKNDNLVFYFFGFGSSSKNEVVFYPIEVLENAIL